VFYTSLGHREDVWTDRAFQEHLLGAIDWLLGRAEGDATPNPQVSAAEQKLGERASAETRASTAPAR
jgi:type 1 glutamine amidotransferase